MKKLLSLLICAVILLPLGANAKKYEMTVNAADGLRCLLSNDFETAADLLANELFSYPKDAGLNLYYGMALHGMGNTDEAAYYFQNAIKYASGKEKTTKALAYNRLGNIARTDGRYKDAINYYENCLKLDPKMQEAYTSLDLIYLDTNDDDALNDILEREMKYIPLKAEGYYKTGLVLNMYGRKELALEYLNKAIGLDPEFSHPYLSRCEILWEMGRKLEAIDDILRITGLRGGLVRDYKLYFFDLEPELINDVKARVIIALNRYPDVEDLKMLYVQVCLQEDSTSNALEKLSQLDPNGTNFEIQKSIANAYLNQGRSKEARKYALNALEIDDSDLDLISTLALADYNLGKYDESCGLFYRLAADTDRDVWYYFEGMCLMFQRKYEEADDAFSNAIETLDISANMISEPYILISKALVLNRLGRHEEEMLCYDQIINYEENLDLDSGCFSPFAYIMKGDYKKGEELFQQMLENDPKGADSSYYNLACAYSRKGDLTKSLDTLEQYVSFTSEDAKENFLSDPDLDPLRDNPRFIKLYNRVVK